MDKDNIDKLIIKKDFFIKSRKEDIREFYEFSPKVLQVQTRCSEEELMASSIKLGSKNLLIPIVSSNSSPKKWSKTQKVFKIKSKSSESLTIP